VKGGDMAQAKYGHTVKVHYTAKLHDGTVLSSTFQGKPLEFTIGVNHVMRDFEKAIIGMNVGEAKNIAISGERMFGPNRENSLIEVDRKSLAHCSLKIGRRVKIPGKRFSAKVVHISEAKVLVDTNHPLCGEELSFDIYLLAIL
jgi:peptidylprolyl isomerase